MLKAEDQDYFEKGHFSVERCIVEAINPDTVTIREYAAQRISVKINDLCDELVRGGMTLYIYVVNRIEDERSCATIHGISSRLKRKSEYHAVLTETGPRDYWVTWSGEYEKMAEGSIVDTRILMSVEELTRPQACEEVRLMELKGL